MNRILLWQEKNKLMGMFISAVNEPFFRYHRFSSSSLSPCYREKIRRGKSERVLLRELMVPI